MDVTRREFLELGGAAALRFGGLGAGGVLLGESALAHAAALGEGALSHDPSASDQALAEAALLGAAAVPLDSLSLVSVAASSKVGRYGPAPTRSKHYGSSDWYLSAPGVLWRSIAGLADDGDPVAYLRRLAGVGGTVLIKPNWVEHQYWTSAKITHPTMVWAMAAMAAEAVGPRGHVWVAEATAAPSSLPIIVRQSGSAKVAAAQRSHGLPVRVIDLNSRSHGRYSIYLGGRSRFAGFSQIVYDGHSGSMGRIGQGRVGRYLIARPVIKADLVIDFAKAKVHCSAGVTLAMKNLLGIVPSDDGPYGDGRTKDVPHYSSAEKARGRAGIFLNNATIGRSMADLAAIARYVARDGSVQRRPQRHLLSVIDGIVAGEASQFKPRPARTGWVAAGLDPVAVDHVATRCMGFDPVKVRSLAASRGGRLVLGTNDPRRVALVYSGPGTFGGYFGRRRALDAEQARIRWGDRIDLGRFSLGHVYLSRPDALTIEARTETGVATVRLEYVISGKRWAHALARVQPGLWRGTVPVGAERLRLVCLDRHFNVVTRGL